MVAILDRFKKKKPAAKAERPAGPRPASASAPQPERPKDESREKPRGKRHVIGVVIAPHVTEKASLASGRGWYAFRVRADANKIIVKRAVEDRYGVTVERVRILRRRPKRIRLGRIEGRTPGFKKAMVKVKAGQTIELT